HSAQARAAFNLSGDGIKVCVLSDSYNTTFGNAAATDVSNGDLPADVQVLQDNVKGTDEGRAMLQLIHDIAPDAELAFRTGFVNEGDFANGIYELQQEGCDIIVDDI